MESYIPIQKESKNDNQSQLQDQKQVQLQTSQFNSGSVMNQNFKPQIISDLNLQGQSSQAFGGVSDDKAINEQLLLNQNQFGYNAEGKQSNLNQYPIQQVNQMNIPDKEIDYMLKSQEPYLNKSVNINTYYKQQLPSESLKESKEPYKNLMNDPKQFLIQNDCSLKAEPQNPQDYFEQKQAQSEKSQIKSKTFSQQEIIPGQSEQKGSEKYLSESQTPNLSNGLESSNHLEEFKQTQLIQKIQSKSLLQLLVTLVNMLKIDKQELTEKQIIEEVENKSIVYLKLKEKDFLSMSYDDLLYFPKKRLEFKQGIQKIIAQALGREQKDIKIFAITQGSIEVYALVEYLNQEAEQGLIQYIPAENVLQPQEIAIIRAQYLIQSYEFNDIYRKYNWFQHYFFDSIWSRKRGPPNKQMTFDIPHAPWYKIGMQVGNIDVNFNWMSSSCIEGAWNVMYYSGYNLTILDINQILIKKEVLLNNWDVETQQLNTGIRCYSKIKDAKQNTLTVQIEGSEYQIVFQCRVNPTALEELYEGVFVVPDKKDIRPYGLLYCFVRQAEN